MTIAWFFCPYKRNDLGAQIGRYCAMDDYTAQIVADGGAWAETEVLDTGTPANGGTAGWALVKVRANDDTLTTIDAATGFIRIASNLTLSTTLGSLSATQKNNIKTRLRAMGYTNADILAAFPGDLGSYTLGQLLTFIAQKRQRPRYDAATDSVICDGQIDSVRPVNDVDALIK